MRNVVVFDTETISVNKRFCYNVGYVIVDVDSGEIQLEKDYVIEQIWHNKMLFETGYYAEKRPIYVSAMRGKKAVMKKWGWVMQDMIRDFTMFNVECAFAFNSSFDDGVFDFNCDWFKTKNPFDNLDIYDIRAYAMSEYNNNEYKAFCERYNLFTESGNYATTAESFYRFLINDNDFNEEHTALSDSRIECAILLDCYRKGENIFVKKSCPKSMARAKAYEVFVNGELEMDGMYSSLIVKNTDQGKKIIIKD